MVYIKEKAYKFRDFPFLKQVDTAGAGDCYMGAFACKMLENPNDYRAAMKFANKSGFLCITKFGVIPSVPYLNEINEVFQGIEWF